jgi:hypothetical protein
MNATAGDLTDLIDATLGDKNTTDDASDNEPDHPAQNKVQGIVTFTYILVGGTRDSLPLEAYGAELLEVVELLAIQAMKDVKENLIVEGWEGRNRILQDEVVAFDELKISSIHILRVGTLEFTSDPVPTESGVFSGGACPIQSGNIKIDRCEEISTSINLLVGSGYMTDGIHEAFQGALDAGVNSGRLEFHLRNDFPDSRATILTGQLLEDLLESSVEASSDEDSVKVVIAGISAVVLVSLSIIGTIFVVWIWRKRIAQESIEGDKAGENESSDMKSPVPSPTRSTLPSSPTRSNSDAVDELMGSPNDHDGYLLTGEYYDHENRIITESDTISNLTSEDGYSYMMWPRRITMSAGFTPIDEGMDVSGRDDPESSVAGVTLIDEAMNVSGRDDPESSGAGVTLVDEAMMNVSGRDDPESSGAGVTLIDEAMYVSGRDDPESSGSGVTLIDEAMNVSGRDDPESSGAGVTLIDEAMNVTARETPEGLPVSP